MYAWGSSFEAMAAGRGQGHMAPGTSREGAERGAVFYYDTKYTKNTLAICQMSSVAFLGPQNHRHRWWLGLHPKPQWRAYSAPQIPSWI